MRFPHLSRVLTSSTLLFFGAVVMLSSLQSLHAHTTFAAGFDLASSQDDQLASSQVTRLLDGEMPNSLPYLMDRGYERVGSLFLPELDQPRVFMERSVARSLAAQYAFDHGDEMDAFSTLSKGFVYVHRAVMLCREQGDQCQASIEQRDLATRLLHDTALLLKDQAQSDTVRAKSAGILAELEALPRF